MAIAHLYRLVPTALFYVHPNIFILNWTSYVQFLGWHIISPLSPFIFDLDLLEEVPGPWVSKNRMMLHSRRQEDVQELQDRSSCYSVQEEVLEDEQVDGAAVSSAQVVKMHKDDQHQWTEIHNPLPMPSMDDDRHYHQIPL